LHSLVKFNKITFDKGFINIFELKKSVMPTNRELFFSYLGLPSQKPMGLEIQHAKGIYLYDQHGNKYIDLVSGVSVSNTGHLHPEVVEGNKTAVKKVHAPDGVW
jgi:4-aminobutyrate aminotransferase-like enzyme